MTEEEDVKLVELLNADDGKKRRSFSQLSTYTSCSEQFRLERIVRPRVPQRPALWNTLGTGVHHALETWINSHRTSDMHADFDEGYEIEFAKQIEQQPDFSLWNNPYRGTVLEAKENVREKGHEQISALIEYFRDPEHSLNPKYDEEDGTPWTEVGFEIELGGVLVVGKIDLVEDGDSPLDYKTGRADGSKILQLGIYKLALEMQFGAESSIGQFWYTKGANDKRLAFGRSKLYDLSRYTQEYVGDLFAAMENGINNEVFIPNPSPTCTICGVKDYCRSEGYRPIPLNWEEVENPWWV